MATILLIDDHDQLRATVRRMLEALGNAVVEAPDGLEGLRRFHEQPFDIVFCDLQMPGINGLETIRRLRQLSSTISILAMSGSVPHDHADIATEVYKAGANNVLAKPFGIHLLRDALALLLGTPRT